MILTPPVPIVRAINAHPEMPLPGRVLLTTPTHFQVEYAINPHMEGNIGSVDESAAMAQWRALRDAYLRLGVEVEVLEGVEGLPDMVFCANQTLPYVTPGGERGVVLSRMHNRPRKPEVEHYERFFAAQNYQVQHLDPDLPGDFEGMGDAIWHPGRYLLWGGYGFRTDEEVYRRLSARFGFPILTVRLDDPAFYHLDTCLCLLDEETALYYPGAFDDAGRALIEQTIPRLIEAPEDEARNLFACNAHTPDGKHVLIQQGCDVTNARLADAGFSVIELDTSEFLKSGGSVFCMKLMFW